METDWPKEVKNRATELRPRVQATTQDTALAILEELRSAGHAVLVEGDSLRVKPAPDPNLKERIRKHKGGILVLLKPAWWKDPGFTPPIGWEQEWRWEQDILQRRLAACADQKIINRLQMLLAYPVENSNEWASLYQRIQQLEQQLRDQGELPPAVFFAAELVA